MEQSNDVSETWVTTEAHRVFEAEFTHHMAILRELVRAELKKELHPEHGVHHVTYAQDLISRGNFKKGFMGSLGGFVVQAFVIGGIVIGGLKYVALTGVTP